MKNLLIILTILIVTAGCGEINRTHGNLNENKTTNTLAVENEVHCDSIEWSRKCTSDLRFRNLKINETTLIVVSEQTNEEFLKQIIKPQDENRIDISSLKKGIYYFELFDTTGLVFRDTFVKK